MVRLPPHARFTGFSKRPLGDPRRETNAMFSLSVNSRAEVDEIAGRMIAERAIKSAHAAALLAELRGALA